MLRGLMPLESVTTALESLSCSGVFTTAGSTHRLASCHYESDSSMLHVSVIGPFEFDRDVRTFEFHYADVFGLADTLRSRDVVVDGVYTAPIDATWQVITNPPVDVHHVNIPFGDWVSFAWGPSEESQCVEPLGARCYGRTFGDYAFQFPRGEVTPSTVGKLVDGRPTESRLSLKFWFVLALSEAIGPLARANKRFLSSHYVYNPPSPLLGVDDLIEVPRDHDTVFWFSWRMPTSGILVDLWFHSHSTTGVDASLGIIPHGAGTVSDPPPLVPSYLPVRLNETGFPTVASLQARVLGPTNHLCTAHSQWRDDGGFAIPLFPRTMCVEGATFHVGAVFRIFVVSHAHGLVSHEDFEHWQPIVYFVNNVTAHSLYGSGFGSTIPTLYDSLLSDFDGMMLMATNFDPSSVSELGAYIGMVDPRADAVSGGSLRGRRAVRRFTASNRRRLALRGTARAARDTAACVRTPPQGVVPRLRGRNLPDGCDSPHPLPHDDPFTAPTQQPGIRAAGSRTTRR